MKKLLSGLLLAPMALAACGEKKAEPKVTVEYSLGHGKYTNANNGTLGTQNASYNVIKSMITDTEGKLTYSIEESTKYVDTTHADTKIDLPTSAKAVPTWVEKTKPDYKFQFSIATVKPWYTEGTGAQANITIKGNDGDATVAIFASTFDTNMKELEDAFKGKTEAEQTAILVDAGTHRGLGTSSTAYAKDDKAFQYAWFIADATITYPTQIEALAQAWVDGFPTIDGKKKDNTGQSLRYVYDVVSVDAGFINKLWDGTDRNLAWESKTDANYGGDRFNLVTNTDKLVAFLNKDFDTCEKVNAVSAADIKAFASNKADNSSAVTGATFSEGGLYRASAITAAQKACK